MEITERVLIVSNHILKTGQTIRQTAALFHISKSTVHIDISKRLVLIDPDLYNKLSVILRENYNEKHIRGGLATKKMKENRKKIKN